MMVMLASFAVTAAALIVLPGPDTTVVLRSILHGGRHGGISTGVGICCGLLVWLAVTVVGLSALLTASRAAYDALKIAGAIYLGWLGFRTLLGQWRSARARRSGIATDPGDPTAGLVRSTHSTQGWFLRGLATDLLNPKVGVLFVTFLPQFIPATEPTTPFTLLLGGIFIAGTAVWFVVLIALAHRVGAWLERPRTQAWLERVTGVALLGFAAGLLADAR